MYVQVNIGRNVGNEPMSEERWLNFQLAVTDALNALQLYIDYTAPAISYEVHTSPCGVYDDEVEESAHISTIIKPPARRQLTGPEVAEAFNHLNEDLRRIAEEYGQDSVALLTSSKLLKPRTPALINLDQD